MVRLCPVCGKPQQNLHTHLSRTHKMNNSQRQYWLGQEKCTKGSQRFTPYPQTKPVEDTKCDRFQLLHPFTALVTGMTGSGKTVWVQKLLEHAGQVIQPPPQRIVWSYSQWQPAYDQMLKNIPGIEFVKGIPHDLDEDWYFNSKINNLMVIDDQMTETSNDKRILNLFTKGSHHRNLSVIFLLQNVYFQGKIMRTLSLNAAYLVLFKNPRDKLQMMTLGKQMYPGKTEQFLQKYEAAVQRPYGYLFVDLKPNTADECRLRTNVLPDDALLSQTGGQTDALKTVGDFFQRQGYLQSPLLKVMQELEEQMNSILNDPRMSPDVKTKEYGMLFNRYLALQQQLPHAMLDIPRQEPTPFVEPTTDQSPLQEVTTPQNTISMSLASDSGIATATPKEPTLLQRLTSKVRTPFKTTGSLQGLETPSTPLKVPRSSSSTPVAQSLPPMEFPPTPPSTKETPVKWIRYQDINKYRDYVVQPPRRSERLRATIQSIPSWIKY